MTCGPCGPPATASTWSATTGWCVTSPARPLLFLLPVWLLQADEPRQMAKVLRASPWWPVEAVVVSGLVVDATVRVVAVVDHATGALDLWMVDWGSGRGWLQGDDRTWFWMAVDAKGKRAVIAPPCRSHVALLERRALGGLAVAQVRTKIQGESTEWARRQWEQAARAQHHATMQQWSGPPVSR